MLLRWCWGGCGRVWRGGGFDVRRGGGRERGRERARVAFLLGAPSVERASNSPTHAAPPLNPPRSHLGHHQQRHVHPSHQQVRDHPLDIRRRSLFIPFHQDHVEHRRHHAAHQTTIVAPDCLDPLAIHLVPLVRVGPQQPGVALLVHEQVGAVDFLKLELDGRGKTFRDEVGRLSP